MEGAAYGAMPAQERRREPAISAANAVERAIDAVKVAAVAVNRSADKAERKVHRKAKPHSKAFEALISFRRSGAWNGMPEVEEAATNTVIARKEAELAYLMEVAEADIFIKEVIGILHSPDHVKSPAERITAAQYRGAYLGGAPLLPLASTESDPQGSQVLIKPVIVFTQSRLQPLSLITFWLSDVVKLHVWLLHNGGVHTPPLQAAEALLAPGCVLRLVRLQVQAFSLT